MEIKEQRGVVAAALGALNADQRAALVLVDMEGYSVEEAAQILGCAPGTVKSRCARGRARAVLQLANPGNLRQHRCRHLRRRVGSRTGEWLVASTCSGHCAVGARRKHHLLAHQGLSDGRRVAIDRVTLLEADHDRGSGPRGREGVSDAERSELSTLGTWPRWAYTRVAPDSGTAGRS